MNKKGNFQQDEFIKLVSENRRNDALYYKNSFVPSILYKFYPLLDEYDKRNKRENIGHKEKNSSRLTNLENQELWFSRYDEFNDPFEFKSLYLDESVLSGDKISASDVENSLSNLRESRLVCCFSKYVYLNLPLWAYYANNHHGYCVRFEVESKDKIYRVHMSLNVNLYQEIQFYY